MNLKLKKGVWLWDFSLSNETPGKIANINHAVKDEIWLVLKYHTYILVTQTFTCSAEFLCFKTKNMKSIVKEIKS